MNSSNDISLYVDLNICSFLQQISDLFEKQQIQDKPYMMQDSVKKIQQINIQIMMI